MRVRTLRYVLTVLVLAALARPLLIAQSPLRFDAASIKPSQSLEDGGGLRLLPQGIDVTNFPVRSLIAAAYKVRTDQVIGGPAWIDRDRFDIKATAGRSVTPAEVLQMEQALLADRFKLSITRDTRELPVWALVMARGDRKLGPSMRACEGDCTPRGPLTFGQTISWTGRGISVAAIAQTLASYVRGTVVDRTGLTGAFDFELKWSDKTTAGDTQGDTVSVFTALQEQLGLKLESSRGPVDVLIVEDVQKPSPD
jgi:uncharacterized protein (TIGR03435 family)